MKTKIIGLACVSLVFLFLSSLKVSVVKFIPKVEIEDPNIVDWAEDTTISKQKLRYLNRVYESAGY